MGDRCYLEITYRKQDEEHFTDVLCDTWYDTVIDETEFHQTVCAGEANYGLYEERQCLAKNGVCFVGWHGPGGEYGEAVFAAFGGEWADVPGHEHEPHVPLQEDGTFNAEILKEAKLYHELAKKARKFLGTEGT